MKAFGVHLIRLGVMGTASAIFVGSVALAQDVSSGSNASSSLGVAGGPNPEFGIPIEGWMFYPSLFVGAVFNDNVYNSSTNRKSAVGVRLRPSFEANRDSGIHHTTVYMTADAQFYPGKGPTTEFVPSYQTKAAPSNATGRAGFSHIYEPLSDLSVRVQGDYSRSSGLFGANFGAGAPQAAVANAASVTGSGQYTNQFTGSVSVEKKLYDRAFIRGTGSVQYVKYDDVAIDYSSFPAINNRQTIAQNTLNYTASLRGGYWVTPQVYAFVEPGAVLVRYPNSYSDTNGYRVIGGFGSDLISLFRGEIYGGYQSQSAANGRFGTVSAPAFGARLSYYPLPYLTFTLSADQTLSAAPAPQLLLSGIPVGWGGQTSSGRTLTVRGQMDYAFSPYWTAFARGGYGETRSSSWYAGTGTGSTIAWTAGTGMSYTFWRNVALTLEYQFTKTKTSNAFAISLFNPWAQTNVTQNLVSAGVTYRY